MESADCGSLNPAKGKQAAGRKSRQLPKKSSISRVSLEKVLGISTVSSSCLTSDPNSGLIAYPAGCVIVLLHPKNNKQSHIINTSRKPFSALAFSHDGKHLVTGESGHMPCVRVWEVDGGQVAEVQTHKYGVSCVAFSTNSCYIVSVGYQHDMTVSVWDWKKGWIIASNKVSSRVLAVSFSQDNSYFVTAGNRHVKFWYMDTSKERRVNKTVPLIGRSVLLGDHKNNVFSGVACGRGLMASSTYCITSSGLLYLFNSSRQLEAWVNLKTKSASCLAVSEDFIFCGCANGVVRVFSPSNLQYVTTLHRPHCLGVNNSLLPASPEAQYPDTLALTFDPAARHLTCVYNDHSVYVWDVKDVRNVGKLYSALYHSSCVWNLQVYPELSDPTQACLPPSSFLTCSSDDTIRLWHTDLPTGHRNLYSNDLLRILYVGENTQHLQAERKAAGADGKSGIRVLGISPDGQHLAAGDRCGNLRIFGLEFLDELMKIEAHDSEVLCLEFSPSSTDVKLLASASRDRLIHIFNVEKNYSLQQTLNDHSASITAVKFTGESPEVRLVSCGADKSIYFQTAEQTAEGLLFCRSHHVVEKTTVYDMDLDSSRTHVATACQDRNVRVYNVETGKLKKCLKGSSSDEGALLTVHMDPSGSFFATSCSDKNITIFDYESGECVATLFGHSEIVTCMRFSQDCRHLITVSLDSCVFVWRLDSQMTSTMRKRQGLRRATAASETCSSKQKNTRSETFIVTPPCPLPHMEQEEEDELRTPARLDSAQGAWQLQTNGKLPMWFRKLQGQGEVSSSVQTDADTDPDGDGDGDSDAEPRQVRSQWAKQLKPLIICSHFSPSPTKEEDEEDEEDFHPQSLDSILGEEEKVLQTAGEDWSSYSLDREFDVQGVTDGQPSLTSLEVSGQGAWPVCLSQLSPDSACSEGSTGSVDQQQDTDTDSLSQGSSVGSLGLEDDEDRNSLKNPFDSLCCSLSDEKFDTDVRTLQPPEEKHFLNPRLSISARFLSRFQDRIRAWPSQGPPPISIPSRISESSDTSVNSESSREVASSESTQKENSSDDVTSKTLAAVQQGAPRLRYLGTTTSSRAKVSQGPPSSNTSSSQEEDKESLSTSSDLHLDQTSRVSLPSQQSQVPAASSQALATPTEVMSPVAVRRWSISSVEETPTNQNRTVILNPSPSISPTDTDTPTSCDVITSDIFASDVIASDVITRQDDGPGEETRIQTDAVSDLLGAPTTSSPLSDRLRPPHTGDVEAAASLQQCQQVVNELRQTVRRAVHLYRQLGESSGERQQMSVLQEAIGVAHLELQAALQGDGRGSSAPSGDMEDDRTTSLLEKYSELLVQMIQKKMDGI